MLCYLQLCCLQGSGGYIQSNMKCDLQDSSLACHNFEVTDGIGCFDYNVSVQCCSSSCEKSTPSPQGMPVSFAIDFH